jgi:hypothetical protein
VDLGELVGLWRYPVKSMAGEALSAANVGSGSPQAETCSRHAVGIRQQPLAPLVCAASSA